MDIYTTVGTITIGGTGAANNDDSTTIIFSALLSGSYDPSTDGALKLLLTDIFYGFVEIVRD